jgi:tetratricopeptide (TPR) repeat protein
VAWITEFKNVISVAFCLLSIASWLRFEDGEGRGWYLGALGLFLMALLSKTAVCCSLPVVFLLLRWKRGLEVGRRAFMDLLPFFALAAAMALFTLLVEISAMGPEARLGELHLSLLQRVILTNRTLWFYPMKLLWPARLCFSYERWALDARDLSQWLWVLATLGAGSLVWRFRSRLGREPMAALGIYMAAIAPALGFANCYTFRYSFVADHYQYLASLGLIAIAAGGMPGSFRRRLATEPFQESPAALLSAIVLALLGTATWRQSHVYRDSATVWRDVLAKNPASWLAHSNLGTILNGQGDFVEAAAQYREALGIRPDLAEIHNNLGVALAGAGRVEESVEQYHEALRIKPDYVEALNNLGRALAGAGRAAEAAEQYREALRIKPDYAEARNNLGMVFAGQGGLDAAAAQYRDALRIQPDFAEAHNNLGLVLVEKGGLAEAVAHYQEALRIRPDFAEAHNNLGNALAGQGRMEDAAAQYREALRIKPDYAEPHNNLGMSLAGRGELREAAAQYQEAVRIRPGFAEAHNNLGNALAMMGSVQAAFAQYREALRFKPDFAEAHDNWGRVLLGTGQVEAAIAHFREALRIKPDFMAVRNVLDQVLSRQGKLEGTGRAQQRLH